MRNAPILRTAALVSVATIALLATPGLQAQQVPIPTTAAEVPGPAPGTAMTTAYVQTVGAYGLPVGLGAGQQCQPPRGFFEGARTRPDGRSAADRAQRGRDADQLRQPRTSTSSICANQDVVYGVGYLDNLDNEPIVFQVPDFGDRFWVYALYDARTDEFSQIGKQYGTKPGFYMVVGPNWKGETPKGITAVLRSSTTVVAAAPRVFMDDTPEDHTAVQPLLSQVVFYPLSQFDGKMKTKDWSKLPHFPAPKSSGKGETQVGEPGDFLRRVAGGDEERAPAAGRGGPLQVDRQCAGCGGQGPGDQEDAYGNRRRCRARVDHTVLAVALQRTFRRQRLEFAGEQRGVGNRLCQSNRPPRSRTCSKTCPEETKYIYTDDDSQGQQLDGQNLYSVTFAKGQLPSGQGFLVADAVQRRALLQPQSAEALFAGHEEQEPQIQRGRLTDAVCQRQIARAGTRRTTGYRRPTGLSRSTSVRYWADKAILDGTWQPPQIEILK